MKEHLILDNSLSLIIGANLENQNSKTIVHPAGDTTQLTVKQWGAFKMIVAKTFHKNKIQIKSALSGIEFENNFTALYLADNDQILKIEGGTKIEGNVKVPKSKIEGGILIGEIDTQEKLFGGSIEKSENTLPKIKSKYRSINIESLIKSSKKIDDIGVDSVYSFENQTTIYTSKVSIFLTNEIKGNIIIHSFEKIEVSSNAKLENSILIAPKIIFQKGFLGAVQAYANQEIIVEENVQLSYPSTLFLNETEFNDREKNNGITIKTNSKVLGGILILSEIRNFRKPISLLIEENAIIGGIIYNEGNTDIKGKLFGSLYTQNISTNSNTNHLYKCTISNKKLPKEFIIPDCLEEIKSKKNKILQTF